MSNLKEEFSQIISNRKKLSEKLNVIRNLIERQKKKITISKIFIYGLFSKKLPKQLENLEKEEAELQTELEKTILKIRYNFDENDQSKSLIDKVYAKFENLSKCEQIWDITSTHEVTENKSSASTSVKRVPTKIKISEFKLIECDQQGLLFENQDGRNLIFYPNFMVSWENEENYELYLSSEIELKFNNSRFLEEESIPSDSEVIGETWKKVNKGGGPDKRFKGNYKIPIVKYAEIAYLFGNSEETFQFSNYSYALHFAEDHLVLLKSLKTELH
jgi:hypothetical protein